MRIEPIATVGGMGNKDTDATAIETRNLTKRFRSIIALRDLSVKISRGEVTVLFGPNGSGKTTLIRILSTLSRPTSGSFVVDGINASSNGREVRKRIGVVLHDPLLYDELTAAENLRFYCRMYGAEESRIDELLNLFELKHRRNDRVATLSSGMIKRLSIARAVIHDPDILLFDEPFSSLDTTSRRKVMSLIECMRDSGKTILLTTHHLKEGYQIGERLLVMRKGRTVLDVRREDVSADEFQSRYDVLTGVGL